MNATIFKDGVPYALCNNNPFVCYPDAGNLKNNSIDDSNGDNKHHNSMHSALYE